MGIQRYTIETIHRIDCGERGEIEVRQDAEGSRFVTVGIVTDECALVEDTGILAAPCEARLLASALSRVADAIEGEE